MKVLTQDKEYYTVAQLGPKQSLTPEGFLLCEDVPIGRTGVLQYGMGETPIDPAPGQHIAYIERNAVEVFHIDTLASFAGKPVTFDHPLEPVSPENWRLLEVGTILNPRQGEGSQHDLMLADLLIKDPEAIRAIRNGEIREVSSGYDCHYDQLAPGRGRQTKIIGNHVALVDKGRCGPRCSIGDKAMAVRNTLSSVAQRAVRAALATDKLVKAFTAQDRAAFDEGLREVLSGDVEMGPAPKPDDVADNAAWKGAMDEMTEMMDNLMTVVGDCVARMDASDGHMRDSAPEEMKDRRMRDAYDRRMRDRRTRDEEEKKKRAEEEKAAADRRMKDAAEGKEPDDGKTGDSAMATMDSSSLAGIYQETVSRAEILVPGIKFYAFDARANAKLTSDALCALRRKALSKALENDDTAPIIRPLTGDKPDLKAMACDALATLFTGSAELVRQHNSLQDHRGSTGGHGVPAPSGIMTYGRSAKVTPAQLNSKAVEFWKNH